MSGIRDPGSGIRGFEVRDAGDSAILLELEPVIDPAVNARAIAIATAVRDQQVAGVRDVIPTYRSVAVHFDPLTCDIDSLRHTMREAAALPRVSASGSLVEVPVAYGGDNGPDLDEVAAFARLPGRTVIDRHCGPEYRVFMLGFLPGFAYMGIVDESIAAPRKATPRTRIPAGSVGIAGRQTGVYPRPSPGGWQLIGRTSLQVFDPSRDPASLLRAGDRVRFVPIDNHSPVARAFKARAEEPAHAPSGASHKGLRSGEAMPGRRLTVVRPGLFTTIQDDGRWGYQDRGVPVSGPMDRQAHHLANALVGNVPDAAAVEATLLGPELRFDQPAVIAVSGADLEAVIDDKPVAVDTPHRVESGGILRFGARRSGTRAYIAIEGGIDVLPVLGSRSTHVISGLGGIDGRALRAGDRLALGSSDSQGSESNHPWRKPSRFALVIDDHVTGTRTIQGARLRAMRGPQDYYFQEPAFDWLARTRFTISPQSDRMGYRLVPGASRIPNPESRMPAGSMISDAAFTGGIQIPPSGEPILLMADRQTTGGYPQIATVITADLRLAGQLAPGDWIEFAWCTRREAIAALTEQEEVFGAR